MTRFLHIAVLILYIAASDSIAYDDVANSLAQYLSNSLKNVKSSFNDDGNPNARFKVQYNNQLEPQTVNPISPKELAKIRKRELVPHDRNSASSPKKIRVFKPGGQFRGSEKHYPRNGNTIRARAPMADGSQGFSANTMKEELYRLDGVLNSIRRKQNIARRAAASDSHSSSLELRDWKNEWKELWVKKKLEALNQTVPQGDVVNMVAARPWGVPCGDPGQHDMPWGSCVLPMECESEYRIYRGDFRCGRTEYVCCSIQLTNYDMYGGFDLSFADSGLTTDSDEQRNRGKGSTENRKKKKEKERKQRALKRKNRKKKIKDKIQEIIDAMKKILDKQYKNSSTQRKRKTKQLKKFIKDLKKKYKQDRKSVKNIHETDMMKIDDILMKKLNQIKEMNSNFVANSTFRDIVVNGTVNKQGARMLVQAYPELIPFFTDQTRRDNELGIDLMDELDYDVEYGMLYY